MFDITREMLAYAIITGTVILVAPFAIARWRQRRIDKLRRRGIKTYGH